MPRHYRLSLTAQNAISEALDIMFDKLKARLLGPGAGNLFGKQIVFRFPTELSLTGLYQAASQQEGMQPREEVMKGLLRIAGGYLDASREKTRAKLLHGVQQVLTDAQNRGVDTDVETVLQGKLTAVWRDMSNDVKRIAETETTTIRNTSIFDAIGRIGALTGREDPTVIFIVVRDNSLCEECKRLHLMPDGVTPRAWKMSELGSGYHKKGEQFPKVAGAHCFCRCTLTHVMPGYGLNSAGRIAYIAPDYDLLADQRQGFQKSEPLEKGWKQNQIKAALKGFGWVEKAGGKHDTMEHPAIGAKITFQRGYVGDYDWKWVDTHLEEAGLKRSRKGILEADPTHRFYAHYVNSGHAKPLPTAPQIKTWQGIPGAKIVPIESLEMGDFPDTKLHAQAVHKMKTGNFQNLPAVSVMETGEGKYGSLDNHHLVQAAKDSGMTHVPVVVGEN